MENPYFLLASYSVNDDTISNAIFRRWTARKGWREIDPERGRFILKPYLAKDTFGAIHRTTTNITAFLTLFLLFLIGLRGYNETTNLAGD